MSHEILSHFKGVIDSTLREGLQFAQSNFSPEEERRIYDDLARIGVDFVEVGNPAGEATRRRVAALTRRRKAGTPRILAHVRNRAADIASAADCGVDGVNILCTADPERLAALGLTPEANAARLSDNIREAKRLGLQVRAGVEDTFGQDPEAGESLYAAAQEAGADRIAAADTLGRALPWDVQRRIRVLRRRFRPDIEVHFHNDLGHSVSNALAALRAGANFVSVTLLGIGERTGITPLSSLLANLFVLDERTVARYGMRRLSAAECRLAGILGMDMPPHLMTSPKHGFAHKAGIHLDALIRFGPQKYECLAPSVLGNRRQFILRTAISGKTGDADVRAFRRRFGGGAA